MNRLIAYGALGIFAFYWSMTMFFTLPDNYLLLSNLKYERLFSTFFYQKWSFFAPPPNYNDRLYYIFEKDSTIVETFEVIEDVQKQRSAEYLFNDDISTIDYVLSNTISTLNDIVRESYNMYSVKNCDDENQECFKRFLVDLEDEFYDTNELQTLTNYGLLIAQKNGVEDFDRFSFQVMHEHLPKFIDRNNSEAKTDTLLAFASKYYNLKEGKWEK